ncbi:MAG: hypothetical protein DMF08_03735 [Verrucomicrobia bacterium]|nr:MAG: hypothetical protein DMF08_03735 [Verrucomicrobiota bacterium]
MGCAALVFCRQIILSPPTAIKGPFVFEADMHPENESTTLNKCNPKRSNNQKKEAYENIRCFNL